MKKAFKRTVVALVLLLAFVGTGATVAFASGYISWGGTADYEQTLVNLDGIKSAGGRLVASLDDEKATNSELNSIVKEKEARIKQLEAKVEQGNKTDRDSLKQAEKDMKDVQEKSSEVLDIFK